jgi:hypothetical protein
MDIISGAGNNTDDDDDDDEDDVQTLAYRATPWPNTDT